MYTLPPVVRQIGVTTKVAKERAASSPSPIGQSIRRSIAKQLSRDRVLHAAAEVFAEQEPATVSVEDILRRAAVSRATFYKMFKSKEDVLAALYEVVSRIMLENSRQALETAPTAAAAIDQSIDMFLGLAESDGMLMRVLENESMRHGSPAAAMREANLSLLCELICARVKKDFGREIDPLVARGVLHALEGISLFVRKPKRTEQSDMRLRAQQAARRISHAAFGLALPEAP